MIEPAKIVDNMKPVEERFKKNKEFSEDILPVTKYDEQYIVIRQRDDRSQTSSTIHYYITDNNFQIIGRFDASGDLEECGITYHIVEEFQNRGIGQAALGFVTNELFELGVRKVMILAVNERSCAIASKIGFKQKSRIFFEMSQLDYQQLKSNGKALM